jgi:tetratricopeptide (TPR) repeat protein
MYFRSAFLPLFFLLVVFQSPQDPVRQHYEAAEAQRRAGNLAAAEAEYGSILAEGYGKLGKIYSAQKQYIEAVSALKAAALYGPDSQDLLIDLAIAYFNAGQYDKALEPLRKALDRSPQSVGAHHMAGKSYVMLGEFEKARGELETAQKLAPNDYEVAYTLGLAYLKQRQFDQGKQIFERILQQLNDRPQLRVVFGRAYRETGFLAEAIEEFKKAVALDPNFPRVHYYLGLTYLLKDGAAKLNDAAEEFKLEMTTHPEEFFANPDQFFANYYLGIVCIVEKRWELAISYLQKATRLQPNDPDAYLYLGQAYQAVVKHEQAIEVLKKSIALTPDLSYNNYQVTIAHYRLGQSLVKIGQTAAGEKELQIASQLKSESFKKDEEKTATYLSSASLHEQNSRSPGIASIEGMIAESKAVDEKTKEELKKSEAYYAKVVASAHNDIGLLRAEQQDFRAAAGQFAVAAKWNPQLDGLNLNWGLASFKAELYKDAIPPLERELAVNPTSASAQELLGLSYFMADNYPRAAALLRQVIASKPNAAGLYYPLAVALVKQGKTNEAERVIQQMIAAGGNSPQVHILLGQAYYEQGDAIKALEELRTALTLDSKVRLAHYYAGETYLRAGKFDEAAAEFEGELALNPNDIQAKYHLGFVLLASQKTERGIKLMSEVIRLKPDYAEAHYELGKALLQQGDIKGAVESLEIAAKLKPDESYVHYQLGRAYLAAGRKAEGDSQLEISKQLKERERSQTNP